LSVDATTIQLPLYAEALTRFVSCPAPSIRKFDAFLSGATLGDDDFPARDFGAGIFLAETG
jgi:hypothetical protein